MADQSKLQTDIEKDDPVTLDADFQLGRDDRRFIDNQIQAVETHLVDSLLSGCTQTWAYLSGGSVGVVDGDNVTLSGEAEIDGIPVVTKAVAAALSTGKSVCGIVTRPAAPGSRVRLAISGVLPSSITGVSGTGLVRCNTTTARCEVLGGSYAALDYPVGTATAGSLNITLNSQNQAALVGGVTDVLVTSPMTTTGGSTPTLAVNLATGSTPGLMSSADKAKSDLIAGTGIVQVTSGTVNVMDVSQNATTKAIVKSGNTTSGTPTNAVVLGTGNAVSASNGITVGTSNTVDGNRSIVCGSLHSIGGTDNVICGLGNTVEGTQNVVAGQTNHVRPSRCIVGGDGHEFASGADRCGVFGNSHSVNEMYQLVHGLGAKSKRRCERVFASGNFSQIGDAQGWDSIILRGNIASSTLASVIDLGFDGNQGATLTFDNNHSYTVEYFVNIAVSASIAGLATKSYWIRGVFSCDQQSGTISIYDHVQELASSVPTGAGGWAFTPVVSGSAINLEFSTGNSSQAKCNVVCTVRVLETVYP